MTTIVPAIIPESFSHLHDEVAKVKEFVSLVQVDIADGRFVKNKSWPYKGDAGEFAKLATEEVGLPFWEEVDYEFHLMIEEPEKAVEDWIKAGAGAIVVQIETVTDMDAIIDMCKAAEVSVGVSLKPSTDNSIIAPYAGKIDFIQCMGSDELGHHGAELDERVFEKIKQLRAQYPNMPIAIDIGVNEDTAKDFVSAGATKLISGSAIFESGDIAKAISRLSNI